MYHKTAPNHRYLPAVQYCWKALHFYFSVLKLDYHYNVTV